MGFFDAQERESPHFAFREAKSSSLWIVEARRSPEDIEIYVVESSIKHIRDHSVTLNRILNPLDVILPGHDPLASDHQRQPSSLVVKADVLSTTLENPWP